MKVSAILKPYSEEDFKKNYFKKKALYVPGDEDKFCEILNWNDVNSIINSTSLPNPDIFLVSAGEYKKYESITDVTSQIIAGATLVINKLHQKNTKVGLLAESVGHFFQEPTQVNLYLGQPDIGGFNLHYDTHDVFVFQISGRKKWDIYEPSLASPVFNMKNHGEKKPEYPPYMSLTLQAGDLLYVPRGHWHSVVSVDQPSLHLTMGIKSRTGLDFLKWVTDELSEDSLCREEFTFNETGHYNQLIFHLRSFLNDDTLQARYREFCKNNLWTMTQLQMPSILSDEIFASQFHMQFIIRNTINVSIREESETFVIEFNNKKVTLRNKCRKLVNVLLQGKPTSLKALDEADVGLTKEQIVLICKTLTSQGLLSMYA